MAVLRYAAAFAIVVLSLAGAYYLIQHANQASQPEATTATTAAQATTTACSPRLSVTSYWLYAKDDTLILHLSYNKCPMNVTVVFADKVVYQGPPKAKLIVPVGRDVEQGTMWSFRVKVNGKEIGTWTVPAG